MAGKVIANRVIRIRHLKRPEDMQGCHILFLGKAQSKRIPMLLADLHNAPVLTVGETPGFLAAGGMICFLLRRKQSSLRDQSGCSPIRKTQNRVTVVVPGPNGDRRKPGEVKA